MRNLIIVLGDQLSSDLSSLKYFSKDDDAILMAELQDEASYVNHHKKKLIFIFSAMRHFAQNLKEQGFKVIYNEFKDGKKSFSEVISSEVKKLNPKKVIVTEPSEFRVLKEFENLKSELSCELEIREDNRFIASKQDFQDFAKGKKELVMEFFYRKMRKKTQILIENKDKPVGGKWNYDKDNRNKLEEGEKIPKLPAIKPDKITQEVIKLVNAKFSNNFGSSENFNYAVTKSDANKLFEDFIENRLKNFGKYQDAMSENLEFGFHSIISLYLNVGLLNPLDLCQKVEKAYEDGKCEINSAEGFIRQILGWREFVRGIYWRFMPEYKEKNFLSAKRKMPDFFWDHKKTQMNCLKQTIKQTHDNAYSHHIQRLMITGNFSLLAGIDPKEVNDWYMSVYFDAFEWVELPNTHGMAIFADGGIVATKPYAASGNYINKMSDFCKGCKYDVKSSNKENSCPFNYLYWNFLVKNKKKLGNNHRLRFPYKNLERKSESEINDLVQKSEKFLNSI